MQQNLLIYGSDAFVLELNGDILACLAFHILPQFHSEEKHMRIVSLVVDKKHRQKGIGKQMLKEAERIAVENGCCVIELTSSARRISTGAHAFYAGQGYLADGEKIYFRKQIQLF